MPGRDHYPKAFSVALAGGGVRGGQVIGKLDASGSEVADRPVLVTDLFRSIYHALGIDPDYENTSPNGRPIKLVDGGAVVSELFGLTRARPPRYFSLAATDCRPAKARLLRGSPGNSPPSLIAPPSAV